MYICVCVCICMYVYVCVYMYIFVNRKLLLLDRFEGPQTLLGRFTPFFGVPARIMYKVVLLY